MNGTIEQIDVNAMRGGAAKACALLKVLANPARLHLLCQLTRGEQCVGELEIALHILQPTLSQQLGVLRDENMVLTRRQGKQIYYRIASAEAMAVLQVLYQLFCEKENKS
jgi:DNA-binding transcriptional ArsR family regulator